MPKRFAHLDPRSQVRECLFTDSEAEARRKAPGIEARFLAYWEALAAGEAGDAAAQYAAARRLAEARGLAYLPADQGAERAALREALARLEAVVGASGQFLPATEVAAVLGGVAVPELRLSDLAEEFFSLTEDRRDGKGAGQAHRWMLPRRRALKVAIEVIGDKSLASIAREDALAYRAHWDRRAAAGDLAAAGGPQRYRGKGDAWSAAVNTFLTENGLRESPDHTAYSLRHSFEDRLLEAGVDERLRVELMGHKYKRPAYGQGGTLELKQAAVAKAAL